MKLLPLFVPVAVVLTLTPSCSKSPGSCITSVLDECAAIGKRASAYSDPAAQANYVAVSFQKVDVSDCPADFRVAFQSHVNAWQQSSAAFAQNTGGTAFVEGVAAGLTGNTDYIGQANNRAAYATQQINATYYALTEVAAKYGARIPRSVVGE